MFKYILRFVSSNDLWDEVLLREPVPPLTEMSDKIWIDVFGRTPQLKDWLNKREVLLLKSLMLEGESQDIIKGKISEILLWKRFDVPSQVKVEEKKEVARPFITKDGFLKGWLNKNGEGQQNKETGEGSLQGSVEEGAESRKENA